jgi:hypothetical protein
MIETKWVTTPVFEEKLTISQNRAKRIIAIIEASPLPQTTTQIIEKLHISRGQFHNAKPYLTGYTRVGLQWVSLGKVKEAKKHYEEQKKIMQDGHFDEYQRKCQIMYFLA